MCIYALFVPLLLLLLLTVLASCALTLHCTSVLLLLLLLPLLHTLQGSEAIATRPHKLRLEATVQPADSTASTDDDASSEPTEKQWTPLEWSVVDIDFWLKGNELFISNQEQS
jgi:hypothetical protein